MSGQKGFGMKMVKTGAMALTLSCIAATAWAQGANCARPQEAAALQTAQVQQQLMVAALSCDAIPLYNQFVTAYQKELFAQDKGVQAYFKRLNPKTGTADYHAFKTKMANNSSRNSIAQITDYCTKAKEMYATALAPEGRPTLAAFVSSQPYVVDVKTCEPVRIAEGAAAAR
jgi:hypothetical protein